MLIHTRTHARTRAYTHAHTHAHMHIHTHAHARMVLVARAAQGNVNLPKVVAVAVAVLGRGTRLIAGEVGLRLAAQLHSLQASVPPEVVQVRGRSHERALR